MTHTPAPWKASPVQIYAGKKHIATAHWAGNPIVDVDEAIANAALIAAAPELLVALEALVAADNCNYEAATMRYEGLFDAARAAIAKAKGEKVLK